ncbi:MAG: tetratricopeptide repeat protein [Candidatus Obscuribacterales bacterium]|nr:tetratricopeptide repeat protein [Candidatus Obscuribacterales bacterium]
MRKTLVSALVSALLIASTTVGVMAYDGHAFPGKGSRADWNRAAQFNSAGNRLSDKGKYTEALVSYNKAIAIYPYDASTHYNKGITLFSLSNNQAAIAEYRKSIELAPSWPDPYNNLADGLKALKNFKEAESVCRKGMFLKPSDPAFLITLAEIFMETNRLSEAKKLLTTASKMKPMPGDEEAVADALKCDFNKLSGK